MFIRTAALIKLVLAITLVLDLLDALVFRSGAYRFYIEPESTAGSVVRATMLVDRYYDAHSKNVLVLGNSKIGEGFSAQLADTESRRDDLHFVNAAINGSTLRVLNYLLREIDPNANRFAAVAIMVDYDFNNVLQNLGAYSIEDLSNYPLDTNYVISLLRLTDFLDYPSTFSAPDQRARARRAILFPLQALHEDVVDFARYPAKRMAAVTRWRPGWIDAVPHYAGHVEALPELDIDSASGMPRSWGEHEAEWRPRLENYFNTLRQPATPEQQTANNAYQRFWIKRIVERYAAHHVPIIVFVPPRGPWQYTLMPTPKIEGTIAELRDSGSIIAISGDAFTELEQPQFFFDTLHLNHAGRERFSKMLAQQVVPYIR